jgi:hypothetical protein
MTTIFTHPAVAKYLAGLDEALRSSPDHHADDLRDQVREHLQDALGPDATDAEIEAVLTRLGPPVDLVGESVADSTQTDVLPVRPSRSAWLQRRTWRWWVGLAMAIVLAIAGTTVWTVERSVAGVQLNCEVCDWYTPVDLAHRKFSHPSDPDVPSDEQQLTVPLRIGTPQDFVFTVWNPSGLTQRLIGGPIDTGPGASFPRASLSFSTADPNTVNGYPDRLTYRSSVWISPHSSRLVRES